MELVKYIAVNVVETLLRVLPFPRKTGVIPIGRPNRSSPVLLTCNYRLTVERLRRTLKGIDCYLLVANSRGINVWCAATGGLLTHHDVISVLKTSGIEELVDHRKVILPQLAATGVESKTIQLKTGWKAVWGPVYAKDIPAFIGNGLDKTPSMRHVAFPLSERLEMAVAWAFPISVLASLPAILFWPATAVSLILLVWGISLSIFVSFPLYSQWLNPKGHRIGLIFFDFGRGGFQILLWGILLAGLVAYNELAGAQSWAFVLQWGFISLVLVLILSLDLMGSTPIYKSGLHEDRLLDVVLDEEKCKGAAFCEQVCPRNCFDVDHTQHIATMPRAELCVQCGACIVQCPFDALYFQSPRGEVIPPEITRRFKLNLMGKRLVPVARR